MSSKTKFFQELQEDLQSWSFSSKVKNSGQIVKKRKVAKPINICSFMQLGLSRKISKVCEDLNFYYPTQIQQQAIPIILKGKDLIANAVTGSGKTNAFLLPILQKMFSNRENEDKQICTLIITPTRELGKQCFEMLKQILNNLGGGLEQLFIIGGNTEPEKQKEILQQQEKQCFIIGTPGRLGLIFKNWFNEIPVLQKIYHIVLDEADKLLESGFYEDLQIIIDQIKDQHAAQVLLFSATIDKSFNKFVKDPEVIENPAIPDIQQLMVRIKNIPREVALCQVLKKKSIVFFNSKKKCFQIKKLLEQVKPE